MAKSEGIQWEDSGSMAKAEDYITIDGTLFSSLKLRFLNPWRRRAFAFEIWIISKTMESSQNAERILRIIALWSAFASYGSGLTWRTYQCILCIVPLSLPIHDGVTRGEQGGDTYDRTSLSL